MKPTPEKPQFLLLLRQPPGPPPGPEILQPIMARFMAWMKSLHDRDAVVGSHGLDFTGKVVRGPRGISVSDGPYPEAKEIVGGYVLISADNLDQAVEIARGCPGLDHQMVVEVRPVLHGTGG
jgi:hypothetical protein